jgi:hypothetical protein
MPKSEECAAIASDNLHCGVQCCSMDNGSCADVLVNLGHFRHSRWSEPPRRTMETVNLELSHAFKERASSRCLTECGQKDYKVVSLDIRGR